LNISRGISYFMGDLSLRLFSWTKDFPIMAP
jgi:hypothetical protein